MDKAIISITTIVCAPTSSAPSLSLDPILLDIAAPPPVPIPVARAMTMKKKGKKKPTAARAFAPRPDTQKASTRLYTVWTDMAIIIGSASLSIAFFGSPLRSLTPAVRKGSER